MRKFISKHIPLDIKLRIIRLPAYLTTYQKNKVLIKYAKRKVYILDSPTHANLGDHAIARAQRQFIENILPTAQIIEIPYELVSMHLGYIKSHITPRDLICMIGGGNFGDEYIEHEYSKRTICTMFPDNKIIIFPQTIYYSDTTRGHEELAKTQAVLNQHKHLTIAARDGVSWKRSQQYFPSASSILSPDIVLSLKPVRLSVARNGILCCLRKDIEKNSNFSTDALVSLLRSENFEFTFSDTVADKAIPLKERDSMLTSKWGEFCASNLVITDRLHGMIFSCITETPCVVIDNYNHKIRDFYDTWLTDVPSVCFAETPEDVLDLLKKLASQKTPVWNPESLASEYKDLWNSIS